jgi:flagellar basal body-associated protein FliL
MRVSKNNPIDELFRKHLAQAQMEPQADWTALTQMLDKADRRKKRGLWFIMSIAASLLFLIASGLLLWFNAKEKGSYQATLVAQESTNTSNSIIVEQTQNIAQTPDVSVDNNKQSSFVQIDIKERPQRASGKQQKVNAKSIEVLLPQQVFQSANDHAGGTGNHIEAMAKSETTQPEVQAALDNIVATHQSAQVVAQQQETSDKQVEVEEEEYATVFLRPTITTQAVKKNAIQRLVAKVNRTIHQAQELTGDSSRNELKMEINRRIVAFVNR